MSAALPKRPLLRADDLSKRFVLGRSLLPGRRQTLVAVDGVTLDVREGETLGLVGESGCGKSTLGRCLIRLHDITSGTVTFDGLDITRASRRRLHPLRREMQMIFQDPHASLNPRRRVGDLLAEPFRIHERLSQAAIDDRVAELLTRVDLLPDHAGRFPHEFSGGQRQRIGIARALALRPRLIVADEPVSALDVSIQAQIVNLLADLREDFGLTYVFISHDLAVVRQIATRVAVMYLGVIVEIGPTDLVLAAPRHHYTAGLRAAVPLPDLDRARGSRIALKGDLPSPIDPPSGCRFHTRCPAASPRCAVERPVLTDDGGGRLVACHHPLAAWRGISSGAAPGWSSA